MVRYIQPEIANIADSPTEGEEVAVVVGVSDGYMADVEERALRANASEVEELPFHSLRVCIPESDLSQLFDITGVESIESDEGMEVLAGN